VTVTPVTADPDVAGREVSLELIGLSRRFGSVVALDGLTFSVPPGEVFGFLGPNGAGKTTAMRAIFGVVALEAGQVRWQGRPVTEDAGRPGGHRPGGDWARQLDPGIASVERVDAGMVLPVLGAHRGDHLRAVRPAHRLPGPAASGASPRRSRLGHTGAQPTDLQWPGGQAAVG
jgi:energy-coupling factor transporter ATP-binding protein EcfA2